ncbi:hypothetical protein ACWDUL_20725 [Nocardia niigatensis]
MTVSRAHPDNIRPTSVRARLNPPAISRGCREVLRTASQVDTRHLNPVAPGFTTRAREQSYLPDLERLFGGPGGVRRVARHRWNNQLQAKLDQAALAGVTGAAALVSACRDLAAEQPALHALMHGTTAGSVR